MRRTLSLLAIALVLAACAATATVRRVTGSLFGQIDPALTETDQQLAFSAAEEALRSGQPVGWKNPETGHEGSFRPGPEKPHSRFGNCRDFRHRIRTEGLPYSIRGTACRGADGVWRVVSV